MNVSFVCGLLDQTPDYCTHPTLVIIDPGQDTCHVLTPTLTRHLTPSASSSFVTPVVTGDVESRGFSHCTVSVHHSTAWDAEMQILGAVSSCSWGYHP